MLTVKVVAWWWLAERQPILLNTRLFSRSAACLDAFSPPGPLDCVLWTAQRGRRLLCWWLQLFLMLVRCGVVVVG